MSEVTNIQMSAAAVLDALLERAEESRAKSARIAELEAANAALKAANEWHYLPETPKVVTDVLAAFNGAELPIQCWYNPRYSAWFTSEEAMHFAEGDFHNCQFRPTPYAWRELPPMPPMP